MIGSINHQDEASIQGLDLTPLIDIIFIVLVFLLLTANSQLLSLPIAVPQAQMGELTSLNTQDTLTITVQPTAPHWSVDGEAFTDVEHLKAAFIAKHQASPEAAIILAADKTAPVQALMTVLSLLQSLHIDNTQIIMEP